MDHLLENFPITWSQEKILFADTDADRQATLVAQLIKQIEIKNYSSSYKDALEYLISLILEGIVDQSSIRRVIRRK